MLRIHPPLIKIYEALGSIADGRLELIAKDSLFDDGIILAKVYSSSRGKYYNVSYEKNSASIMSNDNGSFRKGFLGYPCIALLLHLGELPYNEHYASLLKDIHRKDLNTSYSNDFDKVLQEIDKQIEKDTGEYNEFRTYIHILEESIGAMKLQYLGRKQKPPSGY